MPSVRLVAVDLDGTLLRSDGTVSDRTVRVLGQLQAAGVVVVLVSARQPASLRAYAAAAGVRGLAICSNGAILYDLDRAVVLRHTPIDPGVLRRLVQSLRQALPDVSFAFVRGLDLASEPRYYAAARIVDHGAASLDGVTLGDALDLCQQPATKLIVWHPALVPDAVLPHLQVLDERDFEATHSGGPFVEVAAAGVTKATALAALCEERGILARDVMAFGDSLNDVPMLAWAGQGVAVGNAHPVALAAASEVAPSNDADGVAVVLEALLSAISRPRPGMGGLRSAGSRSHH